MCCTSPVLCPAPSAQTPALRPPGLSAFERGLLSRLRRPRAASCSEPSPVVSAPSFLPPYSAGEEGGEASAVKAVTALLVKAERACTDPLASFSSRRGAAGAPPLACVGRTFLLEWQLSITPPQAR